MNNKKVNKSFQHYLICLIINYLTNKKINIVKNDIPI